MEVALQKEMKDTTNSDINQELANQAMEAIAALKNLDLSQVAVDSTSQK